MSNSIYSRHPKYTATIVFVILFSLIMYSIGYNREIKKSGKTKSDAMKHGLLWVFAPLGIFLLLGLVMMVIFNTNGFEFFLYGGDLVSFLFQIIAALFSAMAN